MKILFDIQEKYTDTEIHICNHEKNRKVLELREMLEGMFHEKMTVYREHDAKTLRVFEIIRIYSENKKVYVRTKGETYEVRDRLYVLEESLKDKGFVRISNSEIVNIEYIEKMDLSYVGTIKMLMKNGDETFVSRRCIGKIKEVLSGEVMR